MDDELDAQHLASEEEFFVSEQMAARVNRARLGRARHRRRHDGRPRALETVAGAGGRVEARHGYTRLCVTAEHELKAVDGLLTGLHEPQVSHLDLLTAFLPAERIREAYEDAVRRDYLWHEFGDLNLMV